MKNGILRLMAIAALVLTGELVKAQFYKPIYVELNKGVIRTRAYNIDVVENGAVDKINASFCGVFDIPDVKLRQSYIEAKPEFALNNFVAVDAGLRFTWSLGRMGSDTKLVWKVRHSGPDTYLATVDNFVQNSFYLGIPVGLRFSIAGLRNKGLFLKIGSSFNFKLGQRTRLTFEEGSYSQYESAVTSQLREPDKLAIPMYLSAGFQAGPDGMVNIELVFPCLMEYNNTFSLYHFNDVAYGLSIGIRIPTFRKLNE